MSVEHEYTPSSWETVNCPFCNSGNRTVYERFGHKFQFTYCKCQDCSLIYCTPRPTYNQEFIDRAYAAYYQSTETLGLDEFTNVHTSSIPMFKKEVEHLLQFDTKPTAVLDVGCGMGTFLYAAKPHYRTCVGLDVSAKMGKFVEEQIGVKVQIQQFDTFNSDTNFSLIHMSHVMEHIPNPNEWIEKAKQLLTPDGVLVINVPNKRSLGNLMQHFFYKLKLKKQYSSTWNAPERTPDHLYEPTRASMKTLLLKHGFEILDSFSYSRKDPVSNNSFTSRLIGRALFLSSNLSFIVRKKK